jgi:hypothetical protein
MKDVGVEVRERPRPVNVSCRVLSLSAMPFMSAAADREGRAMIAVLTAGRKAGEEAVTAF